VKCTVYALLDSCRLSTINCSWKCSICWQLQTHHGQSQVHPWMWWHVRWGKGINV